MSEYSEAVSHTINLLVDAAIPLSRALRYLSEVIAFKCIIINVVGEESRLHAKFKSAPAILQENKAHL